MIKLISCILLFSAIFFNLNAKHIEVSDSIILYSLEKTIENNFYAYPIEQRNGKPIYWLYVSDVDIENNEWQFAYIKTNRRNTYIVEDFEVDTIIDKQHYMLFMSFNNLIYNNEKSDKALIDSLVFSEEPISSNYDNTIYCTVYCQINYLRNKFHLLEYSIFKHVAVVPDELNYFRFQWLNEIYEIDEEEMIKDRIIYSYNYDCKDKYDSVVIEAREKKWKQNEYLSRLSEACKKMLWYREHKRKFK